MYKITKYFEFSYAHRLYGYPGKCGNIHGHTARIKVQCRVDELPENGMAIDFRELKERVGSWIDEKLDHRLILAKDDPITTTIREANEDLFELDTPPSAENLAKLIFDEVSKMGFPVTKVSFWESPTSVASYTAITSTEQGSGLHF